MAERPLPRASERRGIVEGFERFLALKDLTPMPEPQAPPAVVFVDLSGFTELAEERGDRSRCDPPSRSRNGPIPSRPSTAGGS